MTCVYNSGNQLHTIGNPSEKCVYFIVMTYEDSITYWNEAERKCKWFFKNPGDIGTIYFDLLVRNGLERRFFVTTYEDGVLKTGLQCVEPDNEIVDRCNRFFKECPKLIDRSVMSSDAKHKFKKKLNIDNYDY